MAITLRPTDAAQPLEAAPLFSLPADLLASPAAQRAQRRGVYRAKLQAMGRAARLGWAARPLAAAVVLVSALHIWATLASITPATVATLTLPAWAYHSTAAALTLVIDSAILFLAAAQSAAAYAGHKQPSRALVFLYVVTGLLNFSYLLRYTPGVPPALVGTLRPLLAIGFTVVLAALIPVVLVAVERAAHVLDVVRLALLVEVETLRGLIAADQLAADQGETHPPLAGPVAPTGAVTVRLPAIETQETAIAVEAEEEPVYRVGSNTGNSEAAMVYTCKYCEATGLSKADQLAHGRHRARHGCCPA